MSRRGPSGDADGADTELASGSEITALLARVAGGDAGASNQLLPLVYAELEAIARGYLAGRHGSSIEPQGLVHELYLRLVRSGAHARDRKHFYTIAALAMRQILVDRARRRGAAKRGGDRVAVTLTGIGADPRIADGLVVDELLTRLAELSERQARIVELRCLVGLSVAEVADVLEVSVRTVYGEWRLARAWLLRELGYAAGP